MKVRQGWLWAGLLACSLPAAAAASDAVAGKSVEWRSPLGLTVTRRDVSIDGAPLLGARDVELRDRAGRTVFRRDGLHAARSALAARLEPPRHPARLEPAAAQDPRYRERRSPAWVLRDGELRAAIVERRLDLRDHGAPDAGEILRDAVTGDVLGRRTLILEAAPQGFHAYAGADGRPSLSPFGDTWPHPTGMPDGWVPTTAIEQAVTGQGDAAIALDDPWLADAATDTAGNNVVAFFNSITDGNGVVMWELDEAAWRVTPDAAQGDFLAQANGGIDFVYAYDPFATMAEYFQVAGQVPPLPDPGDPALNAKIVQAFLVTNWLHDFFYRAGFDEVAGNSQQDNFGRGGQGGDPLLVFSGYPNTFAVLAPDGESAYLALGRNTTSASRRDASMDFPVAAHEWGHVMIDRVAGGPQGMQGLQARAMHEGISDFIGVLVGVGPDDDLAGAFALGHYMNMDYVRPAGVPPAGAAPDAMYYGIRRYPYSTDPSRNPLTLANLVEQPSPPYFDWKGRGPNLAEVHTAGEVIAQALFQCFAGIASGTDAAGFEDARLRMAQYLVAALMLFSERPTFLEARNHLLTVMGAVDPADRAACRSGFAARGFGAGAVGPPASDESVFTRAQDGLLDQDEKLTILRTESDTGIDCPGCGSGIAAGVITVVVMNTGMVDARDVELELIPALAGAVTFPDGSVATTVRLRPQRTWTVEIPVRVDVAALPGREFAFQVEAAIPGAAANAGDAAQGSAVFSAPGQGGGGGGGGGGGSSSPLWLAFLWMLGAGRRSPTRGRIPSRLARLPADV